MENLTKEEREKSHEQEIQEKINLDKRKKLTKKIIVYSILIIIIFGVTYMAIVNAKKPGKYDNFAKCLTEKDVKFYGSFQCPACAQQKQKFGKSMKYVDYIECGPLGQQTKICNDANIDAYPTWIRDTDVKKGVLSFEELSQLSGCNL